MKKGMLLSWLVLGALPPLMGGGVFYNSNKSAEYFRTFDRNSAIDNADIVYYNMAGTVRLPEGLSLNISNQSIFQRATVRTIGNPVVGDRTYTSSNPVLVVPNAYAAYKQGNWAIFTGLETIGATAVREWKDGLPTLDLLGKQMAGYGGASSGVIAGDAYTSAILAGQSPAQAQAAAVAAGLDGSNFSAKSSLKGSSSYIAWRHGAAYRFNPYVSLALAGRLVFAQQSIVGRIDGACTYTNALFNHDLRTQATAIIDTTAKATGYSGEIGINLYPTEAMVFNLTYEQATSLNFKTTVKDGKDGNGLFVDGQKAHLDLPTTWRFGFGYQATPALRASLGLNVYLEGSVDFTMLDNPSLNADHRKDYGNTYEKSAGIEYRIDKEWLVSAGLNFNQVGQRKSSTIDISVPGAHTNYQSIGTGFQYQPNEKLKFNLGVGWTQFVERYENADSGDQTIRSSFQAQGVTIDPRKEYDKRYLVVAFGINYLFNW